jgi:hypothetical protein
LYYAFFYMSILLGEPLHGLRICTFPKATSQAEQGASVAPCTSGPTLIPKMEASMPIFIGLRPLYNTTVYSWVVNMWAWAHVSEAQL